MTADYLKVVFPGIMLQTQEPHRADESMRKVSEWQICCWDGELCCSWHVFFVIHA